MHSSNWVQLLENRCKHLTGSFFHYLVQNQHKQSLEDLFDNARFWHVGFQEIGVSTGDRIGIFAVVDEIEKPVRLCPDRVLTVIPRMVPKKTSGKVQRHRCRVMFEDGLLNQENRYSHR